MRTTAFDLSPLFRTAVGFDRLARVIDSAARFADADSGYPPYNIEQVDDDHYRITMAVAGFGRDDLEIVVHQGALTVKGRAAKPAAENQVYLHRGIAGRAFERRFQLADYIEATGADLQLGVLSIELERHLPEALKPRTVAIGTAPRIETKAA